MTLVATEPATGLVQTFQAEVAEEIFGRLELTVPVARIRGSSTMKPLLTYQEDLDERVLYKDELFEWPSEDAFNDRNRFYKVQEAELQDNEWICLYLKLVLLSKDKELQANHLSKLKILNVWIEATVDEVEPPNARLKAKSALVYITFRLASLGIREHIQRKAIVRRVISETGRLILLDVFTPFIKNNSSPYPWLSGMTPVDFSQMSQMEK
ncbi:unnamed protein product [Eruca vesicaria subsp. sativa]|uniref:Uncharacterized protein n=1 Tax=Eruca vesicaria subsp. sativa TaxID=29727 RepID=A0ABC8JW24_ERUVS|nr:unnamed protein product [Eruca vesicaria subsp. sativa]